MILFPLLHFIAGIILFIYRTICVFILAEQCSDQRFLFLNKRTLLFWKNSSMIV